MDIALLIVLSIAALVVSALALIRAPVDGDRVQQPLLLLSLAGLLIVRAGFIFATVIGGEIHTVPAKISEALLLAAALIILALALKLRKVRAAPPNTMNAAALSREAQLRVALDSAPDPIFVKDAEGRYILINAASMKEMGCTSINPLGRRDTELWDSPVAEQFVESDRKALAGETLTVEQVVTTAKGSAVFLTTKSPLRGADGKIVGLVGVARDITARKKAESELIELEIALEKAMPGIARLGADGRLMAVNPAFAQMLGHEPGALLGKNAAELIHPEDRDLFPRLMRQLDHEERIEAEFRGLRANGTSFYQQVFLVKPQTPALGGIYYFMRDVSDRRRQDERHLRLQKMEAASQLAAHLASDLSNQLTTVLGSADQLAIRLKSALHPDDPAWRALSNLNAAAAEATNQAKKLHAFGGPTLQSARRFDASAAVLALEPAIRRALGESIHLTIEAAPGPARIEFEQSQFEIMIGHLTRNARDAMPEGGEFHIRVERLTTSSGLTARETQGPTVSLTFSDTGAGMSEEIMSRLFEPFFTTKPAGSGYGLGLATTHNAVSRYGGSIEVSSTLGRGTTLRVLLPAVENPTPDRVSPAGGFRREDCSSAAQAMILVCEPDAAVSATIESSLREFGREVRLVRTGRDALDEAQRHRGLIHLLITELSLPDMGGRQLAELVRRLSPDAQALFLAGGGAGDVTDSGYIEISSNIVSKPFLPAELAQRVRAALENRIVSNSMHK